MAGLEDNVRVLTDHVNELAGKQEASGYRILAAKRAVDDGVAARMWLTHGPICARTNMAVSAAESARTAAVSAQYTLSEGLAERLRWASVNYNDADWRAAERIEGCQV